LSDASSASFQQSALQPFVKPRRAPTNGDMLDYVRNKSVKSALTQVPLVTGCRNTHHIKHHQSSSIIINHHQSSSIIINHHQSYQSSIHITCPHLKLFGTRGITQHHAASRSIAQHHAALKLAHFGTL